MILPFYSPLTYSLMMNHLKRRGDAVVYVDMEISEKDVLARLSMINKNK